MNTTLCGYADLIRALQCQDDDLQQDMAALLGFAAAPKAPEESNATPPQGTRSTGATATERQTVPQTPIPFYRLTTCEFFAPDEPPRTRKSSLSRPAAWQRQTQKPPAIEPLATWAQLQPYLRRVGMAKVPGKRLDIAQTVRRLSQGEWLQKQPRLPRASWGHSAQIIIDRSERLTPYWQDQLQVLAWLRRLFPRDGLEIAVYWDGMDAPLFTSTGSVNGRVSTSTGSVNGRVFTSTGSVNGRVFTSTGSVNGRVFTSTGSVNDGRAYCLPAAGSLVLLLGDLGCFADSAIQELWRELGGRLRDAACRPVALLPTAQKLCVEPWQTLAWQRTPAGSGSVEQLLTLLAPAVRIEPGLLREIRAWQNFDAALESAFWQHEALETTSSVAAALDSESLKAVYRPRFNNALSPETQRGLLKRLLKWRRVLPFEIWIEEFMLNAQIYDLLKDLPEFEQDFAQAQDLLNYYAEPQGQASDGVLPWFRRVSTRLDGHKGLAEEIRPALDRLWEAAHREQPPASSPAGFAPANIPPDDPEQAPRTVQVFQQGHQLRFIEAEDLNHLPVGKQGSWLGSLPTRNGQIVLEQQQGIAGDWLQINEPQTSQTMVLPQSSVLTLKSDLAAKQFNKQSQPSWATAIKRDRYGLWAELIVKDIKQGLRWIPPGRFWMGSPESEVERDDDEMRHQVVLTQGFWLFDTAVTQALWQAVMGDNPSRFKGSDRPVEQVSWKDCEQFLEKINKSLSGWKLCLPTEAQWEYACRAGTQTPFSFGDNITPEQVNYNGKYPYADGKKGLYREETIAVKALPCNPWGLYQMHGNVWEWCADYFDEQYYTTASAGLDPPGPDSGTARVVRGGAWGSEARGARAALRLRVKPGYRNFNLGFRCALVQA